MIKLVSVLGLTAVAVDLAFFAAKGGTTNWLALALDATTVAVITVVLFLSSKAGRGK